VINLETADALSHHAPAALLARLNEAIELTRLELR